jgi:hypothetical protein
MDRRPVLEELMFESFSAEQGGVALDVDCDRILRVATRLLRASAQRLPEFFGLQRAFTQSSLLRSIGP